MVREVGRALDQRCIIHEGAELVVAVSGGADSLALLAILEVLARKRHRGYGLHVVHVHHHLRPEADAEADAVREIAQRLGRHFVRQDVFPSEKAGNKSSSARSLRYRALMEVAGDAGADGVVTGHHGTDQLETVLFHLIRGAGLDGLAGMNWRTEMFGGVVVRPLLGHGHDDCVRMCEKIGWEWFEDRSNKNCDKVRNQLRAEVLPVLRVIAPDIESRIWRTTTLLRDISEFIGESADQLLREANKQEEAGVFDRVELRVMNPVVLGFGLRRMANQLGGSADGISYTMVEKAVRAIQDEAGNERQFDWGGGIGIRVGRERVRISLVED